MNSTVYQIIEKVKNNSKFEFWISEETMNELFRAAKNGEVEFKQKGSELIINSKAAIVTVTIGRKFTRKRNNITTICMYHLEQVFLLYYTHIYSKPEKPEEILVL